MRKEVVSEASSGSRFSGGVARAGIPMGRQRDALWVDQGSGCLVVMLVEKRSLSSRVL